MSDAVTLSKRRAAIWWIKVVERVGFLSSPEVCEGIFSLYIACYAGGPNVILGYYDLMR